MNRSSKIEVIEAGRMSESEMGLVFGGDRVDQCKLDPTKNNYSVKECVLFTTCQPHVITCGGTQKWDFGCFDEKFTCKGYVNPTGTEITAVVEAPIALRAAAVTITAMPVTTLIR